MKKQELIDFVKTQLNITLENDKDYCLNSKRKVLYTTIKREDKIKVLSLLNKQGIRFENHIHDNYFIYC